ncbi:hypothetical protein [Pseudomonas sp. Irchel 3E13]|uniref:hypothetical protein n=1 Tax=Pseudomonas sp. Irchel 3E13 TaxID=2008975 RepID=UPI000BA46789|nr:hypothetical protein [Pseudomonas sp. Irchel 3E13]
MKSDKTPHTHTGKTAAELVVEFGVSGSKLKNTVTVPKGTRVCLLEGGSPTWVVDDLSFIDDRNSILYHDAEHYGIKIPVESIQDIQQV